MRLNSNLILNQKYNLKSIVRKTDNNVTLCDLNTKLHLGLNLPASNVFSNIKLINHNLNFNSQLLKWKLLILNNRDFSKNDVESIDLKSSNSNFLFNNLNYKRRKSVSLIGASGKALIRRGNLQKLVLMNDCLSQSIIANKLLLMGMHKEHQNIFQSVYSEQIRTKFVPFYDKIIRKTKLEKVNDNFIFSSSFLNNSVKKNKIREHEVVSLEKIIEKSFKHFVKIQNNQTLYNKNKGQKYEDKKSSYYQNLILAILINNKLENNVNLSLKNVNTKENNKLELLKQLSNESQFKIKEAFKIFCSEVIRQSFFKKTEESYNQYLSNNRYNNYKRYKSLYKTEIKSFKRIGNIRFRKAISAFFQKFKSYQRKSKSKSSFKVSSKIKVSKK